MARKSGEITGLVVIYTLNASIPHPINTSLSTFPNGDDVDVKLFKHS